ncbi:hypothetical protein OPT61_g919 [Boeremia exigua]|uniref:Uncharacterized protein n=1 Tax=Boeremia exigua TaxID=749465 RepID=A0ACC2IS82_9PLEO|nr:hypothetical protein OPT61_g919 [Boeremia exigua]
MGVLWNAVLHDRALGDGAIRRRCGHVKASTIWPERGMSIEPGRLSSVAHRSFKGRLRGEQTEECNASMWSNVSARAAARQASTARNKNGVNGITSVFFFLARRDATAVVGGRSRYDCGARGQYWMVTPMNWYHGAPSYSDLHVVVRMDFAVADFLLDAVEQRLDVGVQVPLVDAGEGREGQCVQPLGDAQVVPPANVLLVRVIGPRVVGHANDRLLDVDEAGGLQVLARAVVVGDWARNPPGCVGEVAVPLDELALGVKGAVVAARLHVDLHVLDPAAAGLQVAGCC